MPKQGGAAVLGMVEFAPIHVLMVLALVTNVVMGLHLSLSPMSRQKMGLYKVD